MTWPLFGAIILSPGGLYLLCFDDNAAQSGLVCAVFSVVCLAVQVLLTSRAIKKVEAGALIRASLAIATLLSLAVAYTQDSSVFESPYDQFRDHLHAILATGLGEALGKILTALGAVRVPVGRSPLLLLLTPAMCAVLAHYVSRESLSVPEACGAALLGLAVVLLFREEALKMLHSLSLPFTDCLCCKGCCDSRGESQAQQRESPTTHSGRNKVSKKDRMLLMRQALSGDEEGLGGSDRERALYPEGDADSTAHSVASSVHGDQFMLEAGPDGALHMVSAGTAVLAVDRNVGYQDEFLQVELSHV